MRTTPKWEETPIYRNLYAHSSGKTKQKREELTSPLDHGLRTMYQEYMGTSQAWDGARTPPVFIIVVNDIPNAQAIFEHVAGYRPQEDRPWMPGEFPEFSNIDPVTLEPRETLRTILVHSRLNQEGEISGSFGKTLKQQADAFRKAMPHHHWPQGYKETLREVLNSVGKEGEPGEKVRCVVSVEMLTEGWDIKTVTHVVGFRRFGTQLLCEQVAGRSLRRVVYDRTDERGFFEPEYADIIGIPFEITFRPRKTSKTQPPVDTYEVRPLEERGKHRTYWPNVTGYRTERAQNGHVEIDWAKLQDIRISTTTPDLTEVRGSMGETLIMETEHQRGNSAVFQVARELAKRLENSENTSHRTELFRSAVKTIREGIANGKISVPPGDLRAIGEGENPERIANQLIQAVRKKENGQENAVQPIKDSPIIFTTREMTPYRSSRPDWLETRKSQLNIAPCDNKWELQVAKTLDEHPLVSAWARNDRQRWQIPYMHHGEWRLYEPDFVARVMRGEDNILNLVIEVKGREWKRDPSKRHYAEEFWCPAVNQDPDLNQHGLWAYLYIEDPEVAHMMVTEAAGSTTNKFSI